MTKGYDLFLAVFAVERRSDFGALETVVVPQRVRLQGNVTRGAALAKVTAQVAKRYDVSTSDVTFKFWADSWSVPGEDVVIALDNSNSVVVKAF